MRVDLRVKHDIEARKAAGGLSLGDPRNRLMLACCLSGGIVRLFSTRMRQLGCEATKSGAPAGECERPVGVRYVTPCYSAI